MADEREQIASIVRIRAGATRSLFESLALKSYPHDFSREVANFPCHVTDQVVARLPDLVAPGASATTVTIQERQLKRYGVLLEHIHQVAEFLESAEVLAIPASLSLYLGDAVSSLLPGAKLILRSDNEFNYFFEPLAASVNRAIPTVIKVKLSEPLGLLKFPRAAKDDVLLHVILAHEAGHFLDEHLNLKDDILSAAGATSLVAAEQTIATGLGLDLSKTSDIVELRRALGLRHNWLGEILSDLVGVHLLGPAYALATLEFNMFEEDPDGGSHTHPPTVLRLQVIEEELAHLGWLKLLEGRGLWSHVSPTPPTSLDPAWPADQKAIHLVLTTIPDFVTAARQVIRDLLKPRSLSIGDFPVKEPELQDLLSNFVPPSESYADGKVNRFSPEEIICSCWLFFASGMPGWPKSSMSEYELRLILGRLLVKALEITRLRTIYK